MSPKQTFLVATCFILAQTSIVYGLHPCNRDRSNLARSIIKKYVLSHAYWNSYQMPLDCPLHPSQDIFSPLEEAKEQISSHKWNCSACGTKFGHEDELDRHLHAQHRSMILDKGQCLADLCDILHCDFIAEEILAQKRPGVDPYARHAPCDPSKEMAIKKNCKDVAEICFPPEAGPKAPLMWGFFHGQICLAHNCNDDVRSELLSTVVYSRPHFQWGSTIFAGFVTTILLGFYIVFWLYMRVFVGIMGEDEFTSLRPKGQQGFWRPWKKAKPKEL